MSQTTQDKHLLYRPHLEVPKYYGSNGTFETPITVSLPSTQIAKKESLITKLESLKKTFVFIPGAIKPATESILDLVLFLLILTDENFADSNGDKEIQITTPSTSGAGMITKPSTGETVSIDKVFKDGHKFRGVTTNKVSESVKILRLCSQSTLDITTYYTERLSNLLAHYNAQLIAAPELEPVLEVTYDTPLFDYGDQEAHNILQALLKSQQEKVGKMRMYQKLYSERESLTILKSLEYSKITLLKLLNKENYPEDKRLCSKHLQVIAGEKHKLDKKIYEYYRYLDSSLDTLEACLNMHITEAIAKTTLNQIYKEAKEQ